MAIVGSRMPRGLRMPRGFVCVVKDVNDVGGQNIMAPPQILHSNHNLCLQPLSTWDVSSS